MTTQPDAIIIGTGVIGTATAFEMAKNGWKTLSLDRQTQIGHGSTAGSCAIIRMHYSTFDGTAFAWEGYHYWRDWADYLGLPADASLAQFKECGCMVMRTEVNDSSTSIWPTAVIWISRLKNGMRPPSPNGCRFIR